MIRALILAVVLAAGGVAGFLVWRGPAVTVATASTGDVAEVVYATGAVEPVLWAKVSSLVLARITEHCGCEGRVVKKGDVLAHLEDRAPQAQLREQVARREFLLNELSRQSELVQRGTATRTAFERAQTELRQADEQIGALRARLEDYRLLAPIDGVVLRSDGQVGDIAAPGTVLFWVGPPKPLHVVAEVNEEDVPRLQLGQNVLLRNDGFPNGGITATLDRMTPKGDPVAKTFRVYLALPEDTPLKVGMSVEANVIVREKKGVTVVPPEALAGNIVYALSNGKLAPRTIGTGIRGTRAVEITAGLAPGDQIVSPLPSGHRAGMRVRLASPQARPAGAAR